MLGNDIVDLRDPDTRPETFRPRFDERVFDPSERRAIDRDADPHLRRWAHWAAKEAAYKLVRQIDSDFVFAPSKLVARFVSLVPALAEGGERRGMIALPTTLAGGIKELELRSFETPDYVHVLALPRGGDWEAVTSAIERVEDESQASDAVRRLAALRIARDLGIDAERVGIGRRGRIPTVEIDAARSTMAISLSHHGRWVACAMALRCDDALLRGGEGPAGEMPDDDDGWSSASKTGRTLR